MHAPQPTTAARAPRAARICALLTLLLATSCDQSEEDTTAHADTARAETTQVAPKAAESPAASRHAPPPAARKPLLRRGREIMSTYFELSLAGPDSDDAEAARVLERALSEIERLEGVLSEWKPETQISQVNAAAGSGEWVSLSRESLDVIQAGLNVSKWSDGAYDLSWAALRGLYRFDGSRQVPSKAEIEARLPRVGYAGIELSQDPPRARLAHEGMAIGTGGIAKGYALDAAASILEDAGYTDYLLFAGGQVQVRGTREGRPWRVGIQHPRKRGEHVGFVQLSSGSVSTSGDYEHAFVEDGTLWHHILDLRTGYPARRSVSVTLIAPQGVYADALSTACFVMGPEKCLAKLDELPFGVEAVVIDPELRVHVSAGLEGKAVFRPPLVDGRLP